MNANLVENYPGFASGIPGQDLVDLLTDHLMSVTPRIRYERVVGLDHDGDHFTISTDTGEYVCRIVVLASGTVSRVPDFPIPEDCRKYIFYEVNPIANKRDTTIAIIGGGDAAFDYALNLSKANQVIILNRSHQVKCFPLLWERASANPNIEYLDRSIVTDIEMTDHGLRLSLDRNGATTSSAPSSPSAPPSSVSSSAPTTFSSPNPVSPLPCSSSHSTSPTSRDVDFLLFAIGREPCLDYLDRDLDSKLERLREEGLLYLIGDVKNGTYRQVTIAMGDGIRAAMGIARILPESPE